MDLGPESVLQPLLRALQPRRRPELVQVRQHPHHLGEAVRLQEVEVLEGLHLEAEAPVHYQQDQVGHFRRVHHPAEVLRDLEERQAALLARHQGHRPLHLPPDVPLGEVLHQGG